MTALRLVLATVTGVATLAGVALADDNFANVEQNGSANDGVVTQGPGKFNTVGTADNVAPGAALQNGSNNRLTITQTGFDNAVGTIGKGFDQTGNRNSAVIDQTSSGNSVGEVQQADRTLFGTAARNILAVTQDGSAGQNSVGSVRQTRTNSVLANSQAGNSATIVQSSNGNSLSVLEQEGWRNNAELTQKGGDGNHANRISQIGSSNTAGLVFDGSHNGVSDFAPVQLNGVGAFAGLVQGSVTQIGSGNRIDRFVVTGDRNAFGFSQNGFVGNSIDGYASGSDNQFGASQNGTAASAHIGISGNLNEIYINQDGLVLGLNNSASADVWGHGNGVGIVQYGSNNESDVRIDGDFNVVTTNQEGLNNSGSTVVAGDGNTIRLTQQGGLVAGNNALVAVTGAGNFVEIYQTKSLPGAANSVDLKIHGSNNNPLFSSFTSVASSIAASAGLAPGRIAQTGANNSITMTVGATGGAAGDNNLFAFLQNGASNTISGSVAGNGNQVVVVQDGSSNFTSFSQTGNFNVIGINQ